MRARYSFFAFALLLGLVASTGANAQGFQSVYSPDGVDVWAVGDAGTCYRSFDSGTTFTNFSLGAGVLRGVIGRGFTHLVIGDAGKIWRTTDNGGTWATITIGGAPNLRGVAMPSNLIAYAVGDAGTILKSIDGGASWNPQTSGTSAQLNAVRFTDDNNGWAIGNGGVVLNTTNGGANWNPVAVGATTDLLAIDQSGLGIWIVGTRGAAYRSLNGGGNWTAIDLKLDAKSDVRAVCMLSTPDTVYIGGGGGFIRRSYDQGATWTFLQHTMQSPLTDMCFAGAKGYFSSRTNRTILRTTNRGDAWSLPTGATISRSWGLKQTNVGNPSIRGSSIWPQYQNPNTFYALMGPNLYRSRDEGETWSNIGTVPSCSQVNAFIVSPKDSNLMVAAVSNGGTRRIVRSTNGGSGWSDVLTGINFGEYGIPLEMHPDKPDTIFFGGGDDVGSDERIYRSTDFGLTWAPFSSPIFRSPCDMVFVPENNVFLVGDGVTGSGTGTLWRSADGGVTFTAIQSTSPASESPGMAGSRLRPGQALATEWSSGGIRRTGDMGLTWPVVNSTSSTWGVSIAKDDPNVVIYGQYSGGSTYTAFDGGLNSGSWTATTLSGTNYSFWARDRATLLALEQGGIYKMNITSAYTPTNTQALTVVAPNGGETWTAGSVHNVTWTGQNIGLARIEYRRSAADPWVQVADVAGYLGTYAWTIPCDPTPTAQVRVYDAWDVNPVDLSNSTFTISGAAAASNPNNVDFGTETVGDCLTQAVTVQNTGNTTLNVNASVATASFHVGRASFSVGPGLSDTVGVTFCPTSVGTFPDTLLLVTNACAGGMGNLLVPLVGASNPAGDINTTLGGEEWMWNTQQSVTWTSTNITSVALDYRVNPESVWNPIAPIVPASQGSYLWTIPNAPTDSAQVRVRDTGSSLQDISGYIRITVPALAATPDPYDMGSIFVGDPPIEGAITVSNPGTAPLVITNVTVGDPEFWVGRTSLTLAPSASDTIGIFYEPTAPGSDTTNVTIYSVDPVSPHNFTLIAEGKGAVGVGDHAPVAFAAWQNQPNPFTGTTLIRYALPVEAPVTLSVYNLLGQRVATLVQGVQGPGLYSVSFGAGAMSASGRVGTLPAGVYFYQLKAGGFHSTHKMLLLR